MLETTAFGISNLWVFKYDDINEDWTIDFVSTNGKVFPRKLNQEKLRITRIVEEIGADFDGGKSLF